MSNLRTRLTTAICTGALPAKREYALRDEGQPGLMLRVRPSGTKTWEVRSATSGRSGRVSLGAFPGMGVKDARAAAVAFLASGTVPVRSIRFSRLCAEHEQRHAIRLKPSGLLAYRSYVRTQLMPAFGSMALDSITRRDVVRWFERYSLTSPGGANRALGILGQMLTSAKRWNMLPSAWSNPVQGIRPNRRRTVGTFLSKCQLSRLGTALEQRASRGCLPSSVLVMLLLTGCRIGEMLSLQWRDVRADRLHLRDSKTGARDVVMGSAARRLLTLHRGRSISTSAAASVFPLGTGNAYERVRTVWLSVKREAGLSPTLRIHDLRHSFASHAIMAGESLFSVSRLLGHKRIQTTARYAHLADNTLREGAERIGAIILKQVSQTSMRSKVRQASAIVEGAAS